MRSTSSNLIRSSLVALVLSGVVMVDRWGVAHLDPVEASTPTCDWSAPTKTCLELLRAGGSLPASIATPEASADLAIARVSPRTGPLGLEVEVALGDAPPPEGVRRAHARALHMLANPAVPPPRPLARGRLTESPFAGRQVADLRRRWIDQELALREAWVHAAHLERVAASEQDRNGAFSYALLLLVAAGLLRLVLAAREAPLAARRALVWAPMVVPAVFFPTSTTLAIILLVWWLTWSLENPQPSGVPRVHTSLEGHVLGFQPLRPLEDAATGVRQTLALALPTCTLPPLLLGVGAPSVLVILSGLAIASALTLVLAARDQARVRRDHPVTVTLGARRLKTGTGRTFDFDVRGREIELGKDRLGPWLRLTNEQETLRLRGVQADLEWVAEFVGAREERAEAFDIPGSLARLVAERPPDAR